jgi:hypothetical protein
VIQHRFHCLVDWWAVTGDVRARVLACGHYLPEEQPKEVPRKMKAFPR